MRPVIQSKQDAFEWAREKGIKTVRLVVYQPKVDGQTEYVMPLEELEAFAGELRSRAASVENARRDHGKVPTEQWNKVYLNQAPNDVECAFCRAKPTCPSALRTLEDFMMEGFDEVISGEAVAPADQLHETLELTDNYNGTEERLALLNKLMKLAPFCEDMITAVRAEVERVLLTGQDVPDFGLDTGRKGARQFKDEEEAENLLNKTMRIAREHIYTFKLKSPTQLEKLTEPGKDGTPPILGGTRWKRVAALVTQNDPKPTVKLKSQIKKPYIVEKPSNDGFDAIPAEDEDLF
jgi:hypothetical protein